MPTANITRKIQGLISRIIMMALIFIMAYPISSAQANVAAAEIRQAFASTIFSLLEMLKPLGMAPGIKPTQETESPAARLRQVRQLHLCPRSWVMYAGETYTFGPIAFDQDDKVVQGIGFSWKADRPDIAKVSSWGEVSALGPGNAVITVRAGEAQARLLVQVREGARSPQSDLEWDEDHKNDCSELVAFQASGGMPVGFETRLEQTGLSKQADGLGSGGISRLAKPVMVSLRPSETKSLMKAVLTRPHSTASSTSTQEPGPHLIDGSSEDRVSAGAINPSNATGNPRFAAMEITGDGPTKTKRNLGSYNYLFEAQILGIDGRGLSVNLTLSYNSRLWSKDTNPNRMIFNYNKGWPAAGWSLGYGRIIRNYDGTATGDSSGDGLNKPGNFLLLLPDATRIHLEQKFNANSKCSRGRQRNRYSCKGSSNW